MDSLVALFLFLPVFTLSETTRCDVPTFSVERTIADSSARLEIRITMREPEISARSLLCLATTLRTRYVERRDVFVLIFTDAVAAQRYTPSAIGNRSYHESVKAYLAFDDKGQEIGLGMLERPTTMFMLPKAAPPGCLATFSGQCLRSFDLASYPFAALATDATSSVPLNGIISRDGRATELSVTDTSGPSNVRSLLIDASLHHLKTWLFDTASAGRAFTVTYSWSVPAHDPGHITRVDLRSPNRIYISASP
jgi:hypothetical protein